MPDARGWRAKIAVVAPSTNTIVQPDLDDLRPVGVTNHFSRIAIPNLPLRNDEDFKALMDAIGAELYAAVDRSMTCAPDYLMMGMSSHMFWDGVEASETRRRTLEDHAGVPVSAGSFASVAALALFNVKRIAIVSPYQPIADREVTRFFEESGYDVVGFRGLRCPSPVEIAHVQEAELIQILQDIDSDKVDAIVQVGTNLSMARLAGEAERWLAKPVIAINTATYWHGLRALGIEDRITGYGRLLVEH